MYQQAYTHRVWMVSSDIKYTDWLMFDLVSYGRWTTQTPPFVPPLVFSVYLPGHHLPSTMSVAVPVCEIKRIPVCELRNKLQKWVGRTRHPLFLRHWDLFIGERECARERESVWMSKERRTHTNAVTIHLIVIYDWSCAAFSVSPPLVRGGRP